MDFFNFIKERGENAKWKRMKTNSVKVKAINEVQTDTTIRLRCTLGWLSIVSDSTDLQGLSAIISRNSGDQIIPLPSEDFLCLPGRCTVTIKKPNYNTYKQEIIIEENSKVRLSPKLIPKGKLQDIEPVYVTNMTDDYALIHGELPDRYVSEAGII